MPVLDGIGASRKIRNYEEINKITKPVYIVAVTANTYSEDKQKCLLAGMNDVVTKPIEMDQLVKTIKHFLKCKRFLSMTPIMSALP